MAQGRVHYTLRTWDVVVRPQAFGMVPRLKKGEWGYMNKWGPYILCRMLRLDWLGWEVSFYR